MEQLPALFLDTTPGELSANQQAWLRNQLSASDREALVFMHHPPLAAGVPYMDNNYPLQNRQAVQAIFFAHPHPITVFCGHYHVEKTIRQQNLTVYITPATYFQIDQFQADFAVDHQRPGFRIIDLAEDKIRHTVRYL
jgi:Icc protein